MITRALFGLFVLFLGNASEGQQRSDAVYVSIAPRNSVNRFLTRLPFDQNNQLVVTKGVVQGGGARHAIGLSNTELLYIIETHHAVGEKIPGEFLRLGRYILVKIPQQAEAKFIQYAALTKRFAFHRVGSTEQSPGRGFSSIQSMLVGKRFASAAVEIDEGFLKDRLAEYSGATPVVIDGQSVTITERGTPANRSLAKKYLMQEYAKLGYQVKLVPYGTGGRSGENVIAERPGTDPSKIVVLSAHLDDVRNAGADDDGSGTISNLSIAKALSTVPLRYTLRFMAFDQEELGMVGSSNYVAQAKQSGEIKNIMAVFNSDMIGYRAAGHNDFIVSDCNENTSPELTKLVLAKIQENKIDLSPRKVCFGRSDHVSFWHANVPTVHFQAAFPEDNPCYHRSCDQVTTIRFEYLKKMAQVVAVSVLSLVSQ